VNKNAVIWGGKLGTGDSGDAAIIKNCFSRGGISEETGFGGRGWKKGGGETQWGGYFITEEDDGARPSDDQKKKVTGNWGNIREGSG